MQGKFAMNYDHSYYDSMGTVWKKIHCYPNHSKFNTKVPNGPFPKEIDDFHDKRLKEGYEYFPKEQTTMKVPISGEGHDYIPVKGKEYFPSMVEDSVWSYASTLNWSDVDLIFSVCA